MPLPMVHLAVAVRLYERHQRALDPHFLLGSLAPDAIHARPQTTRADKNRTHFYFNEDQTAFVKRVHAYLAEHLTDAAQPRERTFAAGYATHVLTDSIWAMSVFTRFRRAADAVMDAAARRRMYYQETEKVDFLLYRNEPWRTAVWENLQRAQAQDVPELLTADEVAKWQEHTLTWFAEHAEPEAQPQYITEEVVRAFVTRATEAVESQWQLFGFTDWL